MTNTISVFRIRRLWSIGRVNFKRLQSRKNKSNRKVPAEFLQEPFYCFCFTGYKNGEIPIKREDTGPPRFAVPGVYYEKVYYKCVIHLLILVYGIAVKK